MAMEPLKQIGEQNRPPKKTVGQAIETMDVKKKKVARSILNNTGIFIGIFLVFVVIVVYTTDIKLTSIMQWVELGLSFFILLFCAYSMYVNASDSGIKAGKTSETYIKAQTEYNSIKNEIVEGKMQGRLAEFCHYYTTEELNNIRKSILSDVGIEFDLYNKKYIGKGKELLSTDKTLSEPQIKAIIKADKVKPIKLTPEMIFKRGRGSKRRTPLGTKPETKRGVAYGTKFFKTCVTSVLTGIIVLDVAITPTWATFAACCLKLMPVILNGFAGYKMGYENIVVDTVNYISDQIDLMHQFKQYVESNPTPVLIHSENDNKETVAQENTVDNPVENSEIEQKNDKELS